MPPRTQFLVHRCTTCGRVFRTAAGLAMHEDAVHATERAPSPLGGLSADDLKPPFPRAAGRWVPLEEFTGHKSFGIFWCPTCEKRWLSAHAFRDEPNQQQCKICDEHRSPVFLWVNDATYYRSDSEGSTESTEESTEGSDRPHLAHLCQRCKSGLPCTDGAAIGVRRHGYG